MRFQRIYHVESDFSVSFGPKPKLNNNKKGRGGEIDLTSSFKLVKKFVVEVPKILSNTSMRF